MSILDNSYPQLNVSPILGCVPNPEDCTKLWDKYGMLPHIRAHSQLVAEFAYALALKICEKTTWTPEYKEKYKDAAHCAGLLHDIAKTWTIRHGGSHQQIGSSIIRLETDNPLLAAAVLHHVVWPWKSGILGLESQIFHIPLLIAYSDKRVKHSQLVTLEERFKDLFERYGKTTDIKKNIQLNLEQAREIENILAKKLEFNIHACTLVSRRLVA